MHIEKILPSKFEVIPATIDSVMLQVNQEFVLTENEIFDIKLVLEEALTNAVKHGNKFDHNLRVWLDVRTDNNSLIIKIKDEGKGFEVKEVPDPTQKDKLNKTSGRGVFLINKIMDEVRYEDKGREIIMKKTLSKKRPPNKF